MKKYLRQALIRLVSWAELFSGFGIGMLGYGLSYILFGVEEVTFRHIFAYSILVLVIELLYYRKNPEITQTGVGFLASIPLVVVLALATGSVPPTKIFILAALIFYGLGKVCIEIRKAL